MHPDPFLGALLYTTKSLSVVGKASIRRTRQSLFQHLEYFFTSCRPFILSDLPGQVGKRGGDLREMLNKFTIVSDQTQEALSLRRVLKYGLVHHDSIFWGSRDTLSLDITCPKHVTLFNQNLHFENLACSSFPLKTSRVVRKC